MKTPPIIKPKLEDLPGWITKESKKKDSLAVKKSKKTSLVKAFDMGIVSEKGFSNLVKQLTLGKDCEIKGNYSYKTHMILDFITHKVCTECGELIRPKELACQVIDKDEEFSWTVEKIQKAREEWGHSLKFWARDKDIKETLGLVNMSNKEISQAVMDCADLEFTGNLYCYYKTKTKMYDKYDLGGAEKHFFGVIRKKTRYVSKRTGYVENSYYFILDTILSNILLANILNGNIQIKPKEFYQLPGGIQNMLNHVLMWKNSWKKPTIITHPVLCKLLDIEAINVTDQMRSCISKLNKAKADGWIGWRSTRGKGIKKRYMVWGKKKLLKPERIEALPENTEKC